MSNTLHLRARAARPQAAASFWQNVARVLREALAPHRHEAIDDATLRDLGMSRSELGSYAAEASGRAGMTRLRVIAACSSNASPDRGERA